MAASEPAPLVDVFISYARSDAEIARNVMETLDAEGFEVWFDNDIYVGATWESLLMSTLGSAKAVLVLWSKRSVKRPWVLKEARIAMDSRRMVPVQIDNVTLPPRFAKMQTAMMPGWNGRDAHPELERVMAGLSRLAPPARIDSVRPGFDSAFLGGEVGLPAVTGVAEEYRYLHFSVIMNPARRLPWYAAYNMSLSTDVKRGDTWLPDPMLPAAYQPHDAHFRGTGFDRGHMATPRAVSWGTARQAQLANHQAFFWTNTVPQHPDMNRGWWLAIELWERRLTERYGKLIGFAGPVLDDGDPVGRHLEQEFGRLRMRQAVRLPRKFWKVVVVADAKKQLRVAAFVLDQEALIATRAPLDAPPSTYRTTLDQVEALTGLDFDEELAQALPIDDEVATRETRGDTPAGTARSSRARGAPRRAAGSRRP